MNPLVLILSNSLLGLMGRFEFEASNHNVSIIWTTRPAKNSGMIDLPRQSRQSYSMRGMGSEDFQVYHQQQCWLSRGLHSRKENGHKTTQNTTNHRQAPPPTGCGTECLPRAKSSSRLFQSLITGINKVYPNESKLFPQSLL